MNLQNPTNTFIHPEECFQSVKWLIVLAIFSIDTESIFVFTPIFILALLVTEYDRLLILRFFLDWNKKIEANETSTENPLIAEIIH